MSDVNQEPWGIESVRLTLFWSSSMTPAHGTWLDVTGEPPETQSATPKSHTYNEEGPFLGGVLAIDRTPDRTDLKLVARAAETTGEIPSLGEYDEIADAFLKVTRTWLARQAKPVRRVALGVVARIPVASRADGYHRLQTFLPFIKMHEESSDFLYQINRPRKSSVVSGLLINRLSRWSVMKLQYATFAVDPTIRLSPAHLGEPVFACRSELDVNSVSEHPHEFDIETVITLIDELRVLSRELLESGDVA